MPQGSIEEAVMVPQPERTPAQERYLQVHFFASVQDFLKLILRLKR
jgi:hypothetical protein